MIISSPVISTQHIAQYWISPWQRLADHTKGISHVEWLPKGVVSGRPKCRRNDFAKNSDLWAFHMFGISRFTSKDLSRKNVMMLRWTKDEKRWRWRRTARIWRILVRSCEPSELSRQPKVGLCSANAHNSFIFFWGCQKVFQTLTKRQETSLLRLE